MDKLLNAEKPTIKKTINEILSSDTEYLNDLENLKKKDFKALKNIKSWVIQRLQESTTLYNRDSQDLNWKRCLTNGIDRARYKEIYREYCPSKKLTHNQIPYHQRSSRMQREEEKFEEERDQKVKELRKEKAYFEKITETLEKECKNLKEQCRMFKHFYERFNQKDNEWIKMIIQEYHKERLTDQMRKNQHYESDEEEELYTLELQRGDSSKFVEVEPRNKKSIKVSTIKNIRSLDTTKKTMITNQFNTQEIKQQVYEIQWPPQQFLI